jgi:ribosome-binding factor A
MSAGCKRSARVADLLQREFADLLLRRIKDPRVQGVTITGVELTEDLRHARVYFTLMGDQRRRLEAGRGLESAKGFMRREIGQTLRIKYTPEIEFKYDSSFDYAERMETLFHQIRHHDLD